MEIRHLFSIVSPSTSVFLFFFRPRFNFSRNAFSTSSNLLGRISESFSFYNIVLIANVPNQFVCVCACVIITVFLFPRHLVRRLNKIRRVALFFFFFFMFNMSSVRRILLPRSFLQ